MVMAFKATILKLVLVKQWIVLARLVCDGNSPFEKPAADISTRYMFALRICANFHVTLLELIVASIAPT